MRKILPVLLIGLLFVFSSSLRAEENVSVTNGEVTVTWHAEKSQVEIADAQGVYAVVPFEEGTQSAPEEEMEASTLCLVNDKSKIATVIAVESTFGESPKLDMPWVFFVQFVSGDGDKAKIRFPQIDLQLPQDVDSLKSFGTAGLKPVDGHKGSYMFLSVVDPETNAGVVSGWLTANAASGIVFSERTQGGKVRVIPECQFGVNHVDENTLFESETFVLGRFDDCREGLEQYADLVAREANVELKPIPAGYCTWYSDKHGGASDETHIRELAEFAHKTLGPYGFNFVQIDDHWQDGVKTNGPKKIFTRHNPKGPYPNGMQPTAETLDELGFMAGLWFMPFAGNVDDPHFPKEWYVKSGVTDEVNAEGKSNRHYNSIVNKEGEPYESYWGGTSLDMTHPEVQAYLREEVERIYSEWGYNYFKLDGLWTGMACDQLYVNNEYIPDDFGQAVFYDQDTYGTPGTSVSVYRKGLEIIRKAAPDAFILGCNVSQNMRMMHPSIGFCDAMRIGPDNGAGWNSLTRGPWHGSNRYFLNGRVWWNDPDPVYVRASMPLEHAQLIASWVAVSGQLFAFSDWLPELPEDRIDILRKTIMPHGLTTARPVDLFREDLPRIWHLWDEKNANGNAVRRDVVAFYNWDDKNPVTIETTAEQIGLPKAEQYAAFDFWAAKMLQPFGQTIKIELPPGSCKVIAFRPLEDRPVLISTSQHVTQGIIDVESEVWDAEKRELTVKVKPFDTGENAPPVELRIAVPDTLQYDDCRSNNSDVRVEINAGLGVRMNNTSPLTKNQTFESTFLFVPK